MTSELAADRWAQIAEIIEAEQGDSESVKMCVERIIEERNNLRTTLEQLFPHGVWLDIDSGLEQIPEHAIGQNADIAATCMRCELERTVLNGNGMPDIEKVANARRKLWEKNENLGW